MGKSGYITYDFLKEDFGVETLEDVQLQLRIRDNGGKWIDVKLTEEEINDEEKYHRSDFRIKPIKEFEVGDWVREYGRIHIITDDTIDYYNGTNYMAQHTDSKHWFPEEDEFMWFYKPTSFDTLYYYHFGKFLCKVDDVSGQTFYYSKETSARFDFVEPFTGDIPKFLSKYQPPRVL
jgi:hypothetical protein